MPRVASFPTLDSAMVEFGDSLGEVKQNLYYCDVGMPRGRHKEVRSGIHAASYVYVAAAVEKCINSTLAAVIDEINSSAVNLCDLRLSLFAMIEASRLESLQQVRGLTMWQRRMEVFSTLHDPSVCELSIERLPLDGRTIRKDHLDTIWNVFGLPGNSIPSPLHGMALRDLAGSRNKLAHGEERASVVAGSKSITDTLRLYEKVEEVIIHFWDAFTDYLINKGYLR